MLKITLSNGSIHGHIRMTGSGKNKDARVILPGAPVSEDSAGNIYLADADNPAFAVCVSGGGPGQIISYQSDGVIGLDGWQMIAGTTFLTPGKVYYLSGIGRLALTGTQQIAIARSKTSIRINIQIPARQVAQTFPLADNPTGSLGREGDFAFNSSTRQWFIKAVSGWKGVGYLVS